MRRVYIRPTTLKPEMLKIIPGRVKILGGHGFSWQPEAYERLKDKLFSFIVAFCGSGKTVVQIALAIYSIKKSGWNMKQLIVVPQQHIGIPFCKNRDTDYVPIMVDGKKYYWHVVGNNFCDPRRTDILEGLRKWLLSEPSQVRNANYKESNTITGMGAVASHQALALVWSSLTPAEKIQAIKNTMFRIDEAHHVSGMNVEDDEDEARIIEENATILGKICNFIIRNGRGSSGICLTTATPFRSNDLFMTKEAASLFDDGTYFLDFEAHFKTLGIERVEFAYEEYDKNPLAKVLRAIRDEPNERHLVVIPSQGEKWRNDENPDALSDFLRELRGTFGEDKVLDLVLPFTQAKNKDLLLGEPKESSDGDPRFRVVVMCRLGREGTDWCPCSRLHHTALENSAPLSGQTLGRLFRRFDKKDSIKITYHVKRFPKPKKGMSKRELLSDRTNALLVLLQFDELFNPILMPKIPGTKKADRLSLEKVFGSRYAALRRDLMETYIDVGDVDVAINVVLDRFDAPKKDQDLIDAMRTLVLRAITLSAKERPARSGDAPPDQMIDVSMIRKRGFDKILRDYDHDMFSGMLDEGDLLAFKQVLRETKQYYRTIEENAHVATKLSGKASLEGGVQPGSMAAYRTLRAADPRLHPYPDKLPGFKNYKVLMGVKGASEYCERTGTLRKYCFCGGDSCRRRGTTSSPKSPKKLISWPLRDIPINSVDNDRCV